PQPRRTEKTARSPRRTRFTASPTSTTSPRTSWPMTRSSRPGGASARPPTAASRSVPQIPTRRTRSAISSGAETAGCGRSTSRTSRVPGTIARAFTVRLLPCAFASASSPSAACEPPCQRAAHGEAGAESGHGVSRGRRRLDQLPRRESARVRLRCPARRQPVILQRHPQHLGEVERAAVRGLADLLAATEPVRDDDRVLAGLADRWQQHALAGADRDLVLLRLEAERAGHAAAAGVEDLEVQADPR